jgi:hypothetical protein
MSRADHAAIHVFGERTNHHARRRRAPAWLSENKYRFIEEMQMEIRRRGGGARKYL